MRRLLKVGVAVFLLGISLSLTDSAVSQTTTNQKTCYGLGNNGFQSWTDYYTYWAEMYPNYAGKMFPFGTRFCDTNATNSQKSSGFNLNVEYTFPFYGMDYSTLWVTASGTIVLNNTKDFETPPAYYSSREWPNPDYPVGGATDPPFIAPFLSQADPRTTVSFEPSQISHRILNQSKVVDANQLSIMEGMLSFITQQVRAAVPGTNFFHATYGVVVTWYELTFEGASCQNSDTSNVMDHCPRNTYQAAIVTDGIKTYTVFNYFNITWVGGNTASQNCDPVTGLTSSANPDCQPAILGFNAGNARGFTPLPYSNSSETKDLDIKSGTNVTGRFIYDVTGDLIRRGGCTNDTNIVSEWPLELWPYFGPMMGGGYVNVSGPCFLNGDRVKCKFDDQVVDATYYGNMMQVICVVPRLNKIGNISVSVSIDGGNNYYFGNYYLVEKDSRVSSQLNVSATPAGDWITTNQITLNWNTRNLTYRDNDRVTISLYGYQEIGSFGDVMSNNWQRLYTYEFSYSNTGVYQFIPSQRPCADQQPADTCATYTMGAFVVYLSASNPWNPRGWWSEVVPLGWFANSALRFTHGHSWAAALCKNWYQLDSLSSSWRNYIPSCPCTLQQAYVDYGRFYPDEACNLDNYNEAGSCTRHVGAAACYRSVNVTSSGAGTSCCYSQDHGYLMYSGDSQYGSQAARAHPWGNPPYSGPPYVPTLSHWYHDIMPWYFCCEWQIGGSSDWSEYDCFNRYMLMRPTGDCVNYNPPGFAMSYGDPHFRTFDGTNYTFNSWGEFWLLQINEAPVTGGYASFSLQGRYQQPKNQTWGQIKATVMTAAAMQLNDGPTISVRTNDEYSQQELLLIYVNDQVLNFSQPSQRWHAYDDFFIVNNDPGDEISYKNFTIVYRLGIGIQVAYSSGLMQLMCTLPPTFKTKTGGLFGYWNGDWQSDLVPRSTSGTGATAVTPGDTNLQNIHYSFGLTWVALESESLFGYLYRAQMNYRWFHQTWFVPSFQAQFPANNTGINQDQVNAVCFSNFECEYDYMVAQNESWAKGTYALQKWDTQMRFLGRYIPGCGWLDTPNAIKQEPICYTAGCAVTITGCRPKYWWKRNDVKTYSCTQQGVCSSVTSQTTSCTAYWNPSSPAQCEWMPLPPGQLAAIIIPIVLIVLGVIIAIVICCIVKRKRESKAHAEVAASRKMEWDFEKFIAGKGPHPGTQKQRERDVTDMYTTSRRSPAPYQPPRPGLNPVINMNTSAVSSTTKKSGSLSSDTKQTITDSWDDSTFKYDTSIDGKKVDISDTSPTGPILYRNSDPPSPIPFRSYRNQGYDTSHDRSLNSRVPRITQSQPADVHTHVNPHLTPHHLDHLEGESLPGYSADTSAPTTEPRKHRKTKRRHKGADNPVAVSTSRDTSEELVIPVLPAYTQPVSTASVAGIQERSVNYNPTGDKKRKKRKKHKAKSETVEEIPEVNAGSAADYYARKYRKNNYGAYRSKRMNLSQDNISTPSMQKQPVNPYPAGSQMVSGGSRRNSDGSYNSGAGDLGPALVTTNSKSSMHSMRSHESLVQGQPQYPYVPPPEGSRDSSRHSSISGQMMMAHVGPYPGGKLNPGHEGVVIISAPTAGQQSPGQRKVQEQARAYYQQTYGATNGDTTV